MGFSRGSPGDVADLNPILGAIEFQRRSPHVNAFWWRFGDVQKLLEVRVASGVLTTTILLCSLLLGVPDLLQLTFQPKAHNPKPSSPLFSTRETLVDPSNLLQLGLRI